MPRAFQNFLSPASKRWLFLTDGETEAHSVKRLIQGCKTNVSQEENRIS